jgi:predicted nucleic acid-binding protein
LGVEQFRSVLGRHRRVALDSSIFIYQLEASPRYGPLSDAVFAWVERPGRTAVTSTITMTELLVQPYRNYDEDKADEFFALLSTFPHLDWVAPDLEIADLAARLRGLNRLRTPDALQAATAIKAGATAVITNDPIFERVTTIETIVVDRFL